MESSRVRSVDFREEFRISAADGDEIDIAYADVTGDGIEEAIVGLVKMPTAEEGGNEVYTAIIVFAMGPDDANARELTRIEPGFGGAGFAHSVSFGEVRPGGFTILRRVHLPDDAHCCPSLERTELWKWNGHEFVEDVSQQVRRRVPQP